MHQIIFESPLIFVLIIIAIAIVLSIFGVLAERKRRQELEAWAKKRGFTYSHAKNRSVDEQLPAFRSLRQGSNRYAYNEMTGEWEGRRLWCFDYHYQTTSTDSKGRTQTHHHYFSALLLSSPFHLKPLMIRPESALDKITEFFGFDDIDFESAEFSAKFFVKAEDRKWAFDILHTRAMEFLLASPRVVIEFEGGWAMAFDNHKFDVTEFERAAGVLGELLDRIPEYVRQQQGELSRGSV